MDVMLRNFSRDFNETLLKEEFELILKEYAKFGIKLRPRVWFSTDWFCPDGVNGFAVPFYLLSKSLMKRLDSLGIRVEGKTKSERAKLFRHEIAHVLDNVYGLRGLKKRQSLFGLASETYPKSFLPAVSTRDFYHIDSYYWQAHPCEDWAESVSYVVTTLNKSKFPSFSKDKKLKYVLKTLNSIESRKPKNIPSIEVDEIGESNISLNEYIKKCQSKISLVNKNYLLKGSINIEEELIKTFKSSTKYPWILDNLSELVKYRKTYLGLETSMSNRSWSNLLKGQTRALGVSGLNRVYM